MVQSAPHKRRVKATTKAAEREDIINVIKLFKNIIKLKKKKDGWSIYLPSGT